MPCRVIIQRTCKQRLLQTAARQVCGPCGAQRTDDSTSTLIDFAAVTKGDQGSNKVDRNTQIQIKRLAGSSRSVAATRQLKPVAALMQANLCGGRR